MPHAAPSAQDCVRLLAVRPLLDSLADLDVDATYEQTRNDLLVDVETLMEASNVIASVGGIRLLTTIRADVHERLRTSNTLVRDMVEHAAFALAFADVLGDELVAKLSLPWALASVSADE